MIAADPPPIALVTGASSGIGRAVARRLCDRGMRVAGCARRHERLEQLADELGDRFLPVRCDLTSLDQIDRMFAAITSRWGGLDILVNNAGFGRKAPLLAFEPEIWRDILAVNVLALSVCTQKVIESMRRRGVAGHVIHISSMSAHRVPGGSGMYSASKFAVRSLTESLRQELREAGSDIRISSISPGFVETEFAERYHGDEAAARATYAQYPVLQPTDIADAVQFILEAPAHVQYHDLLVRPTRQAS